MLELSPYQHESLAAVLAAAQRGVRHSLVALLTGTGKTVVFSHLLSRRPGRSLVLVHCDELIRQAYGKLKEIKPSLSLGIMKLAHMMTDLFQEVGLRRRDGAQRHTA